jgi:hypothetical protein
MTTISPRCGLRKRYVMPSAKLLGLQGGIVGDMLTPVPPTGGTNSSVWRLIRLYRHLVESLHPRTETMLTPGPVFGNLERLSIMSGVGYRRRC